MFFVDVFRRVVPLIGPSASFFGKIPVTCSPEVLQVLPVYNETDLYGV